MTKTSLPRAPLSRVLRRPPGFKVLPAVPEQPSNSLLPSQIRHGMRMSIGDGVFAQVYISITAGSFVTALALYMGASDFVLGLITAMPVLAQLVQLPAAWMVERRGDRRSITVWSSLGRLFWLVPVLLLYVPMDPTARLGIALLAMALAFGLLAISTNAWLSWMSDLIPPSLRGRFFSVRSMVLAIIGLGVSYVGGTLLDAARKAGHAEWGFLGLYTVACAAGLVSTYFVSRQPEPPFARAAGGTSFRKLVQAPWRDRNFRAFIFTLTVWSIGINIAAPFYNAQALKNLHVSYQQLATLDMTTIAVTLLTQPFWGRWSDRVGHRRTLMISMIGASPLALMWLIATPSTIWLIYLNNVLSGIFWPGVNLSLSNRLMERAPAAGRAGYLALYSAITGGLAFLASMFGGLIAGGLEGHYFQFGPLGLNNYQVLFLMAGVIRISVALLRSRSV